MKYVTSTFTDKTQARDKTAWKYIVRNWGLLGIELQWVTSKSTDMFF